MKKVSNTNTGQNKILTALLPPAAYLVMFTLIFILSPPIFLGGFVIMFCMVYFPAAVGVFAGHLARSAREKMSIFWYLSVLLFGAGSIAIIIMGMMGFLPPYRDYYDLGYLYVILVALVMTVMAYLQANGLTRRMFRKLATVKVLLILVIVYICIRLVSEFFTWNLEIFTVSAVLDFINLSLWAVILFSTALTIVMAVRDREVPVYRKLLIICCVVLIYVVVIYLPETLSELLFDGEISGN